MITYKGSVCLNVIIKFNSIYLMLDIALKFRKAFEMIEEDDIYFMIILDYETPKHEDW